MKSLVYVVAMPSFNYVKIGMTDDLKARVAALQTSCPETLEVVCISGKMSLCCASVMERCLHNQYRECRVNGEWFNKLPSDVFDDLRLLGFRRPTKHKDWRAVRTPEQRKSLTDAARAAQRKLPKSKRGGRPVKALPENRRDEFVDLWSIKDNSKRFVARRFSTTPRVVDRWAEQLDLPAK